MASAQEIWQPDVVAAVAKAACYGRSASILVWTLKMKKLIFTPFHSPTPIHVLMLLASFIKVHKTLFYITN